MIETNIQNAQQDRVSPQSSLLEAEPTRETGLKVTCAICEAVYVPSPLQLPFLRDMQGALEAAFMGMCHFCFRCRRAACPQCWDDAHGVCGSCVQEAHLPFRVETAPLDGLAFPPPLPLRQPFLPQQPQVASPFVLVHPGRFYSELQTGTHQAAPDIDTGPVVQAVGVQSGVPDALVIGDEKSEGAVATSPDVAASPKTPLGAKLQGTRKQEKMPRVPKKKVSRLEFVLTWIVLVIVLILVVIIALAEYVPTVNTLVMSVTHIDIHAEIAYLVRMAQQLFKK